MWKKLTGGLLLALCVLNGSVQAHGVHEAQDQAQEIKIKTQQLGGGNVWLLQGRGGNIGASVGKDGILIVDDDLAPVSPQLAVTLKSLGAEYPRFILNTHWHGDHTQGNLFFGKQSLIIAQANVRKRLSVESLALGQKVAPFPDFALPVLTFEDSMSVHFNGEEIRVVHYANGHTDGDAVIFFTKSNIVHTGDLFVRYGFPYIDLDSGGSIQGMTADIAALIAQVPADAKIIPGHGELSSRADLQNFHAMLVETTAIISDGIKQGKTLAQLKQKGLPDKFKSWSGDFINTEKWIETVYNSLTRK